MEIKTIVKARATFMEIHYIKDEIEAIIRNWSYLG